MAPQQGKLKSVAPDIEEDPLFDVSDLSPLEELIHTGRLEVGTRLYFTYETDAGKKVRFTGTVHPRGIEVKGQRFSVSFAAIQCIKSAGDKKAINGWLAWQTRSGHSLSELYQRMKGIEVPLQTRRDYTEKFYKYPRQRDVVFVFGAGASYADGAPLQRDLLPLLLHESDPDLRQSRLYRTVTTFLRDNFVWDRSRQQYPTLEQVFGFMDYFILKRESLSRKYSLAYIRVVREALIKVLHYVITSRTEKSGRAYRLFWEYVYKYNRNVSVITMNYDTYLDDAFSHMFPRNLYLDYLLDLANYDYSETVDDRNWWVNPREPILAVKAAEPISIKIIKIHGSLNWKYCDCCNRVLLTPLDKKFDLGIGMKKPAAGGDAHGLQLKRCARDGNEYQTLLVPPSHVKDLTHAVTSRLFMEASEEVRRAKRVVFIGYSQPEADVHVKAIMQRSLQRGTEVMVLDVNDSAEFKRRYRELSPRIKFMKMPFEELVGDPGLMQSLLTV